MSRFLKHFFIVLVSIGASSTLSAHVTECDWVAGHTTEPERQAPGNFPRGEKWRGAIYACERDLAADPENAHLQYTLGHALYYDHPWQDRKRSIDLIKAAAQQGYPQADFALGLFYMNGELGEILPQDSCKSAEHHLKAARWGRYASLVSYSRNAIKGFYDECVPPVDWNEVREFLVLARGAFQYDWYDGLLIDDLEEQLELKLVEEDS